MTSFEDSDAYLRAFQDDDSFVDECPPPRSQSQSKLVKAVNAKKKSNRRSERSIGSNGSIAGRMERALVRRKSLDEVMAQEHAGAAKNSLTDESTQPSVEADQQQQQGYQYQAEKYIYQLSCKICKESHKEHTKYVGETHDIKATLNALPKELSEAIRTKQKSSNSDNDGCSIPTQIIVIAPDEDGKESSEFIYSPLANHIIDEHCQHLKGRREVLEWWKENVAVQIRTHKYNHKSKVKGIKFAEREAPSFRKHQQEKESKVAEVLKKEEEQYKEKLVERNVLTNEHVFDELWERRYQELKEYAAEHDGDTRVPANYSKSMLLPKWVDNQRTQYRRKHNIRPKLELEEDGQRIALTDANEMKLKEINFAWYDVPKQRWNEQGIAVSEGWDEGGEEF